MRNSMVGVSGMGWPSQRASKRALACLAVLGVGGIAGLASGFSADPVQTAGLSPAEIVALRFPGGASRSASNPVASIQIASNQLASNRVASSSVSVPPVSAEADPSPGPAGYVLASAGDTGLPAASLIFSPFPTYPSPGASSQPRPLLPELVTGSTQLPASALADAVPGADEPADVAEPVMPAARPEVASATPPPAKRTIQPTRPSGPASPSNAVLNNAQIASIRERLKLTSYQSQLWPSVESALRDIAWQGHPESGRKGASGAHGGTIDPNSAPVQRLKSAAFPLIMSLSDDQKQEVRTMVRLMGLENLASQF
jgi:hypothetical protein